ncbi:MAG: MarR family transcriptional regulator [Candidatus Bathyarchaeota archaeon]|jgi:chromosome segregation ATPase|uniref:MarR family transcriptional regulator n=1 Tax=Candidatus Bathycorpusculum sp. TaxID=2994959 RepID=UPI00282B6A52|nr:MarR family transcriptional regulator [Candidatus Termiticorpusculum sp.]MCL2257223.1 MarR family transcriptional regulator [Candidatus Termiticorpusculum sp.]MCL2292331.1 MarR family transcriptional regulator [Candidatus Termiticorpusculum sp.]
MSEVILPILMVVLLIVIVIASTGYYGRICQAQKEYEKAHNALEDIVLSFNRELKRESERLEQIAFKVEGSLAKSDTGLMKIDNIEKRISPVENQINKLEVHKRNFEDQKNIIENQKSLLETQINQLNSLTQNNTILSTTLAGLDVKIKDIEVSQELLKTKISCFEEQIQKIFLTPNEIKVEQVIPVVPIKRDKALASLTNTEVAVLEMLSSEGSKTAPEIKERVGLSREHTARLMKKLYEGGYLEREIGKIPFKYSVKKEMEKFLKKEDLNIPEI